MSALARDFERDGFVQVPGAFEPQALVALRAAALEIVDEFDIDAHRSVFRTDDRDTGRDDYFFDSATRASCFLEAGALDEDGELVKPKALAINKIGHGIHDVHKSFADFCREPAIADSLADIGWRDCVVQQTMYIFKQPGIGGEVRWHQDATYLIAEPPGVVGLWIALEDATRDNGCLWMQPGQHRSPLRERYAINAATGLPTLETLDATPWDSGNAVPVEVEAGTLVLFADTMPHYSATNTSDKSRHAATIHVRQQRSAWSPLNWLQRGDTPDITL